MRIALVSLFVWLVDAELQAPVQAEPRNRSTNPLDSYGLSGLLERQSGCYSPSLYCSLYNKCCPSYDLGCCPDGCTSEVANECCYNGGWCRTGRICCEDGCIPSGTNCCLDGGYCPPPFECVIYNGVLGCCTDLTCKVYLSSGITVTATAYQTAPAATTTYKATTTTYKAATTSRAVATVYYIYYTTLYWYYWYYYYTIYYAPTVYTTRVVTTVTKTTSISCSATDSNAAELVFLSYSEDLPTPTSAGIIIPPTPTAGAFIVGDCTSSRTSMVTDADGSTSSSIFSVRNTVTAGASSSTGTRRTSSTSAMTATQGDATSGMASAAAASLARFPRFCGSLFWTILLVSVPAFIGGAMVLL